MYCVFRYLRLQPYLHCVVLCSFCCTNTEPVNGLKKQGVGGGRGGGGVEKTVRIDDAENANVDAGSIQRKRTAWVTSLGHQRVSLTELNNRYVYVHARLCVSLRLLYENSIIAS